MNHSSVPSLVSVFSILFIILPAGYSQQLHSDIQFDYSELYHAVENEYGFDQELVNGIFYEDFYRDAIGHPFLSENQFYKGTLAFRNKEYEGIEMKYDIYEQELVIYYTLQNSNTWIILPNDFISAFSFEGKIFGKYSFEGKESRFYQVISDSDNLKCFYFWYKERFNSFHKRGFMSYEFSDSKKKSYLFIGNTLREYSDNRSFIRLFPGQYHNRIKEYFKQHHIKVTKCEDERIQGLLNYCREILDAG